MAFKIGDSMFIQILKTKECFDAKVVALDESGEAIVEVAAQGKDKGRRFKHDEYVIKKMPEHTHRKMTFCVGAGEY
ncbi:MAG: hypothetical protein V1928_03290 [Parcubacteria group bacterium]